MSLDGFPNLALPSGATGTNTPNANAPTIPDLTAGSLSQSATDMLESSSQQLQNSLEDAKEAVADESARGLAALGQVAQQAIGRVEQEANNGVNAVDEKLSGTLDNLAANLAAGDDAGSLIPADLVDLPGAGAGSSTPALRSGSLRKSFKRCV